MPSRSKGAFFLFLIFFEDLQGILQENINLSNEANWKILKFLFIESYLMKKKLMEFFEDIWNIY